MAASLDFPGEELAGEAPEADHEHAKWRGAARARLGPAAHKEIGPGFTKAICQQLGITTPPNPR